MAGKAVLLLVMSSFIIFTQFGLNNVNVVNQTYDNMMNYNAQNNAYNIAVAGANIGFSRLNQLLPKPPMIKLDDVSFNGGTFDVTCAKVPGTADNYKLTSTGTYTANGKTSTSQVIITYQPGNWGRWAYYSENEGGTIWWYGTDAIYGPFHTQDTKLNVSKHPYFGDETSIKGSGSGVVNCETNTATDYPNFVKGLATGIDRPMRSDSMDSTLVAGTSPYAWKITGKPTVYLTFNGTQVKYKTSSSGTETTYNITTKAPNGVIWVENGLARIKGTLDGQVTILCTGSAGNTSQGRIYIDDDIRLTDNPRTNPNSNDFLGLVASNDVMISDNDNTVNIYIDAAIFSLNGGFGAENHSGRSIDGTINLYGGIAQKIRRGVGTKSGSSINHGFAKSYRYDTRFENKWPPFYPCGRAYRILSWYDGVGSSN